MQFRSTSQHTKTAHRIFISMSFIVHMQSTLHTRIVANVSGKVSRIDSADLRISPCSIFYNTMVHFSYLMKLPTNENCFRILRNGLHIVYFDTMLSRGEKKCEEIANIHSSLMVLVIFRFLIIDGFFHFILYILAPQCDTETNSTYQSHREHFLTIFVFREKIELEIALVFWM